MEQQRLRDLVAGCPLAILYSPIGDEVDPVSIREFSGVLPTERIIIPPSKETDPIELAQEIREKYTDHRACVFVPGRMFDARGTRTGRGGGWYDRFLAALPEDWIWIGVTSAAHYSNEPLARQVWDQPMDWVVVHENDTDVVFETNARKKKTDYEESGEKGVS